MNTAEFGFYWTFQLGVSAFLASYGISLARKGWRWWTYRRQVRARLRALGLHEHWRKP